MIDGSIRISVGSLIHKCFDTHGEFERFRAGIYGAVGISHGEFREHDGFQVGRSLWMSDWIENPDVVWFGALDESIPARGFIGVDMSAGDASSGVILVSDWIEFCPVITRNAGGQ